MNNLTDSNYKASLTIQKLEGYRDKAYKPVPGDPWTLGYGSTRSFFTADSTCTIDQAESWLMEDITNIDNFLSNHVKVDLTPGQYTALVCLLYNIGEGSFANSKALQSLNSWDYDECARQCFDPEIGFVKSHGNIVQGLVNRRAFEHSIWDRA